MRATRSHSELAAFVQKLRVYAISDQEDAGPWIRHEFPGLYWIGSPSTPDGAEFGQATWTGISGERYYRSFEGADFTTVTNQWLDAHVRKGPLGAHYLRYMFIMEGDTPAFLNLIPNGLASWTSPDWGGWGGRYVHRQPRGESHAFGTQGGDMFFRVTSQDTVTGVDGKAHSSDHATIWRWREAFQNDFAARMDWTLKPYGKSNHPPIPAIDGDSGQAVLSRTMIVGEPLRLDSSTTRDPDGDKFSYHWFLYNEAGVELGGRPADVSLSGAETAEVHVEAHGTCTSAWLPELAPACPEEGKIHLVLAVTDRGTPALTRYRRVIITVKRPPTRP